MSKAANGDLINHHYPILKKNSIDSSTYADLTEKEIKADLGITALGA
jgi:hypothetical protein